MQKEELLELLKNASEAYYNNRYRGARRILDDYSDVLALNK